ncbi:MAG TPA: YwaF family protein [Bacilli bacterium]|nr:YwaF family protein [Bacilli bacterium]
MFKMWNAFHFLFILSPFIFTVIFQIAFRKLDQEKKRIAGLVLSVLAVVILLLRNGEIFVKSGYKLDPEIIPLQICHFANFVLLFAFWKKSDVLFALAFCLNLPAAFISIIFANSLENYTTLVSFRAQAYLWGHMLIVSITLWALLNDFIHITNKSLIKTLLFIGAIYLVAIPVDTIMEAITDKQANYFYALYPEEGTPLEWFYDISEPVKILGMTFRPLYLLLTALLGLVVVMVFYGFYLFYYFLKEKNVLKHEKMKPSVNA